MAMEERLEWGQWVTRKALVKKPIHRWLTFPHSFTNELVHALMEEWRLNSKDLILDPFVGAGTTLLSAKERNVSARGYDLSPLAEFVTRVKIADYDPCRLKTAWEELTRALQHKDVPETSPAYPPLVQQALPGDLLPVFANCDKSIETLPCSLQEKDFLRLALIAIIPQFSRARATGGWLKWIKNENRASSFYEVLQQHTIKMIDDLSKTHLARGPRWKVALCDARSIPDTEETFTAVITSPPYPNRHDYTRVFGVELMFCFVTPAETRHLRYQSFHSHPEARPKRGDIDGFSPPEQLVKTLSLLRDCTKDLRVFQMLEGYFLDIFLCLREARRVCKPGARLALVLGNVQYCGIPVLVDEITAEIGQQASLTFDKILIARYRGNSAQQMGRYGRRPSRESIVIFERPKEVVN